MYDSGEEFLNELYKDLHVSKIVMHTALKSDTPVEKISKYLTRLDRVVKRAHQNEHDWNLFKSLCHDKYVIKEENIKEEYINKNTSPTFSSEQLIYKVTTAAKDSLDTWIDFLGSLDKEEMWLKFWIFKEITSMGNYNEQRKTFSRRTKHTTSPFPMFDATITLNIIDKIKLLIKTNDKELIDEALNNESFAKLYAYYFSKKREQILQEAIKNNGEWFHYEGLKNRVKLRKDIIGKGTLWCIENREDVRRILENDVIDIYFSNDENDEPTKPRLAIVSNNNVIKEIRGIEHNQNVEPAMLEILERKLLSYNQTEKIQKIINDSRRLTILTEKENYTKEDIEFLYEIKEKIGFFGYGKDERIELLKNKRDIKADLANYFDCGVDEIALTKKELMKSNIYCYYGDISETGEKLNLILPNYVVGDVRCPALTSIAGLEKLEVVTNDLFLPQINDALPNLKEVWGHDTNKILKRQEKRM